MFRLKPGCLILKNTIFGDHYSVNTGCWFGDLTIHVLRAVYQHVAQYVISQCNMYTVVMVRPVTPVTLVILFKFRGQNTHFIDRICRRIATGDKFLQALHLHRVARVIPHDPLLYGNPYYILSFASLSLYSIRLTETKTFSTPKARKK